jgi:hypothetical protein
MNQDYYENMSLNLKKSKGGNTTLLSHVFETVEMPKKLKILGKNFSKFESKELLRIYDKIGTLGSNTIYLTCASSMLYELFSENIKVPTLDKENSSNHFMPLKYIKVSLKDEYSFEKHRVLYLSLNLLKVSFDTPIVMVDEVFTYLKSKFSDLVDFEELASENIFFKKIPLKIVESKLAYLSPVQQKEYAFDIGPFLHYKSYMSEKSVETDSEFDCLQDHIIQQQLRLAFLQIFSPLLKYFNLSFDKRNSKALFEKGSGNLIFKVLIPNIPIDKDMPVGVSQLFWQLIDFGILFSGDTLSTVIKFNDNSELKNSTPNSLLEQMNAHEDFIHRSEINTNLGFSELYTLMTALTADKYIELIPQIDDLVNTKKWRELATLLENHI